ncbi:hypothetical protein OCU04_007795 [Sclerotinia nivalis]|uniref:Uncharacterized protein n=1 Tax=Sclerotinia nivalis TaxID=352851 RepID=A0A9X0DKC8_9HELO|nr:hypothetical protein OCU04_007795 [Sclerotinia nivalis]
MHGIHASYLFLSIGLTTSVSFTTAASFLTTRRTYQSYVSAFPSSIPQYNPHTQILLSTLRYRYLARYVLHTFSSIKHSFMSLSPPQTPITTTRTPSPQLAPSERLKFDVYLNILFVLAR